MHCHPNPPARGRLVVDSVARAECQVAEVRTCLPPAPTWAGGEKRTPTSGALRGPRQADVEVSVTARRYRSRRRVG